MNRPQQLDIFDFRRSEWRLDPLPLRVLTEADLAAMWCGLRLDYFPERADLDGYSLAWSRRPQRRVLASCNVLRHRVIVAQEFKHSGLIAYLEPLLYHELCHAVIGLDVRRGPRGRRWHGAEFKSLERRHPRIPALDEWIRNGGWARAKRSHRSKLMWAKRGARIKRLFGLAQ